MTKVAKTKTTYDKEGLELAVYAAYNFPILEKEPLYLQPKVEWMRKAQRFLDRNTTRIHENKLRGIICVRDAFRNSTGGRVDLIAGLEGPIVEAIQYEVIGEPIKYDAKNKYFKRALKLASGIKPPDAGNIHFHLLHCDQEKVTPLTILDLIAREHGVQNDLRNVGEFKISVLISVRNDPYWRKNVDKQMLQALFGQEART